MSQKWIRSKQWDDENIPGFLWPVKFVLRAFSSIPLAVSLLSLVALYGTLASVPIGLLARIPTVAVNAGTFALTVLICVATLVFPMSRLLANRPVARFVACFAVGLLAAGLGGWLWIGVFWPRLRYDPVSHSGLLLFADFVEKYRSTTVRRLPGMEMSELEFYSWWPLRLVLLLFVSNLIFATARRIEFTFRNIGVLTVHTGIVTIALGSVYYSLGKQEGDALLLAGDPDERGKAAPGPLVRGFFDNTRVALWLKQEGKTFPGGADFEQRVLRGVPRYNDYGLRAAGGDPAFIGDSGAPRTLNLPIEKWGQNSSLLDPDVSFSVVGYASYAELSEDVVEAPESAANTAGRVVRLRTSRAGGGSSEAPAAIMKLTPEVPARRVFSYGGALDVEYTFGMNPLRWRAINEDLPSGMTDALVIDIPAAGFHRVIAASPGTETPLDATGFAIEVLELTPEPELAIITKGYEGASCAVAKIRISESSAAGVRRFDRWVYERFPEISQDFLESADQSGMPKRTSADSRIVVHYLRAGSLQVYLDEDTTTGLVRSSVRVPNTMGAPNGVSSTDRGEGIKPGERIAIAPVVSLELGERWRNTATILCPVVIPPDQRDNKKVGTHENAAVAVRVSLPPADDGRPGWSTVVWLPFLQYWYEMTNGQREIEVPAAPDSPPGEIRRITLAFGREWHSFAGLGLQLVDFKMTPYPHSETPRDYESTVNVVTFWGENGGQPGDMHMRKASTSLNYPLLVRVPYQRRSDSGIIANFIAWCRSGIAPVQYKFSQAGWDSQTWTESKAMADRGQLDQPFVRFTILGVGTNPGIYIIATGAVMMCAGIPWAFYVKPLLVRRERNRIRAAALAAAGRPEPGRNGVHSRLAPRSEATVNGPNTG